MVTRKPLPEGATPEPAGGPQFSMQDARQELWSATDSEWSGDDVWGADRSYGQQQTRGQEQSALGVPGSQRSVSPLDVPDGLRPGGGTPTSSLSASPSPRLTPAPPHAKFDGSDDNVWRDEAASKVLLTNYTGSGGGGGPSAPTRVALSDLPDVLRPGSSATKQETNPFKRKLTPGTSQEALSTAPPMPVASPPAAPTEAFSHLGLTSEPSNNPWQPALDVNGLAHTPTGGSLLPNADDQDSSGDVWASKNPSRKPSPGPNPEDSPSLISFQSEEGDGSSAAWNEVAAPKHPASSPNPAAPVASADDAVFEGTHAWDDVGKQDKGKKPELQAPLIPDLDFGSSTNGGWNIMDAQAEPGQLSRRSTWEDFGDAPEEQAASKAAQQKTAPLVQPTDDTEEGPLEKAVHSTYDSASTQVRAPELPPRTSNDAPPKPPRPPVTNKTETYQIKNINWHDINAKENPRTSPILVQNANGPCPLVALVNALTLTTPAGIKTALVDTLRPREQVSLTLLLDAVFDELMSPRRLAEDAALPDVSELYDFLKGLHTGMNVNPRFVPTPDVAKAFKRTSLTHMHPTQRSDGMIPGTFESTREMRLYATFAVPLIHGWLPARGDPAADAFSRQAESYEDAQNLLFREEELEGRLLSSPGEGLSEEEQRIYQDILTIKSFLSVSATQLTPYGLEVITEAMKPGSVAILFRNDHFSTLYRHPQTLELLTLVTDAGYAGHAEIVWESLVDVNGERTEFFSGDFRLVGGALHNSNGGSDSQPQNRSASGLGGFGVAEGNGDAGASGWTTVQGRRGQRHGSTNVVVATASSSAAPQGGGLCMSPSSELEDRDLALAMQLQEEEDERHREEQARRRRESMLSEQFIEQQARSSRSGLGPAAVGSPSPNPSPVTGRRTSGASVTTTPRTQVVRPLVPPLANPAPAVRRHADDGVEDAPPSYEQASKQTAYVPPAGHPSHPDSSPRPGTTSSGGGTASAARSPRGRRFGNFTDPQSPSGPGPAGGGSPRVSGPRAGLRQGVPPVNGGVGRDRECIVM